MTAEPAQMSQVMTDHTGTTPPYEKTPPTTGASSMVEPKRLGS